MAAVFAKVGRPRIGVLDGRPMLLIPVVRSDGCVANALAEASFGIHGNGEPLESVLGLDRVAVSPVSSCELHGIEDNEFIYRVD